MRRSGLPEVRCSTSEAKRNCIVHVRLKALHVNFSAFSQQATLHFLSPHRFPLHHLSLILYTHVGFICSAESTEWSPANLNIT